MILSVIAVATAAITLLPAVLVALGDRVLIAKSHSDPDITAESRWRRWTAQSVRRPGTVLAVGLVLLGGLAAPALGMHLGMPSARVVDVLQFVPSDQIDPIYFAKSYYLEPEQPAVKPYVLLRDALDSSGMVGLVKVALRNREQLATLRVRDGVIVLETMIWPDEVREASFAFLDDDVQVRPQEQAMAESLVASMAGDFEPEQYHDDYREALQKVIDAKIEGREVVETAPAAPDTGQVVDLMAALRASVEAAKRSRGEAAPAKKAPAKKAPAKKVAAKKAPARKAPAKKVAEKAARRKSA